MLLSPRPPHAGPVVREVVLTGGPCAGKTTALDVVATALRGDGWRVLVVPEAATMLISGGVADIGVVAQDAARMGRFQSALVATQSALRDRYRQLARALGDERTVILYDRAECDSAAYVGAERFEAVLESQGRHLLEVRDSYDAVVHLVTAAVGAEHAYTTANNEARLETPAQARELDAKTLRAWTGHPRLAVVGNHGDFDHKLARIVAVVRAAVGEPVPVEIERKYLLGSPPQLDDPVLAEAVRVEMESYYPPTDDLTEVRLRRRRQDGASLCTKTTSTRRGPGVRATLSETLDPLSYMDAVAAAGTAPVRKSRRHLVFDHQVFVLDHLVEPIDAWLVEAELWDPTDTVRLPSCFAAATDVTGDPAWAAAALASGR